MHQIKLFNGLESDLQELEGEINSWLAESGAKVVNVFGNMAPQTMREGKAGLGGAYGASDVFLALLYETG